VYQTIKGSAHHMPAIPDGSVQAICTSPPYFGLRAYQGDQSIEWPTVEYSPMPGLAALRIQGCEPGCVHEWADGPTVAQAPKRDTSGGLLCTDGRPNPRDFGTRGHQPANAGASFKVTQGAYCVHCGGWRGGLGLEPTIEAYIGHLILCLREWRRVLRADGLCWVNLGDSYAASSGQTGRNDNGRPEKNRGWAEYDIPRQKTSKMSSGLKPKDLMMIPARFALAAQADGWYLRSAVVWAKGVSFLPDYAGSCMPESVTDRPTQSYEMVYMLAKSERYFYDTEAVKEQSLNAGVTVKTNGNEGMDSGYDGHITRDGLRRGVVVANTRNLRNVWVINPSPYAGAHFACWPEKLVEPMIKASTPEKGCCAACGGPYRRVVERKSSTADRIGGDANWVKLQHIATNQEPRAGGFYDHQAVTTGWQPTCQCAAPVTPCTVLDPFAGSGTTLQVAVRMGRHAIGVDLSAEYLADLVPVRMDEVSTEPKRLSGGVEDWADTGLFAELA
jgi:DNA modification methylase